MLSGRCRARVRDTVDEPSRHPPPGTVITDGLDARPPGRWRTKALSESHFRPPVEKPDSTISRLGRRAGVRAPVLLSLHVLYDDLFSFPFSFIYFFSPLPSKMLKLQFTAVEVPGIGGLRRSGQLALIKQAAASHKLLLVDTSTAAQTLKKAL